MNANTRVVPGKTAIEECYVEENLSSDSYDKNYT